MKASVFNIVGFCLLVVSYTTLFANDLSPFTVKRPTITQGIHASDWEAALVPTPEIRHEQKDDSDGDTILFDEESDGVREIGDEMGDEIDDETRDIPDLDCIDIDTVEIDEEPDSVDLVAVTSHQNGRKWGEWYGKAPLFKQKDLPVHSSFSEKAESQQIERVLKKQPLRQNFDGFSLSLWGDSSLVINAGANYTWKYLYSSVSFGTDLYTPAINRPYFLRIHTGGSYPFSNFLVRSDVGYRLNLNQGGNGASNFTQHQFEFRAAAGYRFNSWLLLLGGTGVGYGFSGTKSGKLSPLFYGGIELF